MKRGAIRQKEGMGEKEWVVIGGEIQTHDMCKLGQSCPYRVTEIMWKTEIFAFLLVPYRRSGRGL